MKFKSLMTVALGLSLGFASCSSDEETPEMGNGRGETTEVSVSAKQSILSSYAPVLTPQGDEGQIKTSTTYIYDGAGVLEAVAVMTGTGATSSATGVTVTTGPKTFYVVANAPAALALQLTGNAVTPGNAAALTEANFKKALIANGTPIAAMSTVAVPTAGAGTGFFMTIPNGGKTQTMNPGSVNAVNVIIGRAFAKTNITFDPTTVAYDVDLGGTLQNVAYMARNNKSEMYNQSIYNGFQLESYWFNQWAAGPTPAIGATDFFIEGGTVTTGAFPATSGHFTTSTVADGSVALYSMENSNNAPLYGTASFLQLGGKFVLDAATLVYDATNVVGSTINAAGDFYRIVEFDDDPTVNPTNVKEVVRHISNKFYSASPNPATIAAEITAFAGVPAIVAANVGVLKYDAGRVYYSLYLTNPAATTNAAKEVYMVERNKFYDVTVNSVNTLGSNTSDITNPGGVIKTTTDISAGITVGDWADASSGADL